MKKYILILVALVCFGISARANCTWDVYDNKKTNDGWGLCISYDNRCSSVITVKITYRTAYKRHCDENWSYKDTSEYRDLQPNRGGHTLVGSYSTTYNSCTTRYNLLSVEQVNN